MGVRLEEVLREQEEMRRVDEARQMRKDLRTPQPGDDDNRQNLHLEKFRYDLTEVMHKHIFERGLDADKAAEAMLELAGSAAGHSAAERNSARDERALDRGEDAVRRRYYSEPPPARAEQRSQDRADYWAERMKAKAAELQPMKHFARKQDRDRDPSM